MLIDQACQTFEKCFNIIMRRRKDGRFLICDVKISQVAQLYVHCLFCLGELKTKESSCLEDEQFSL